MTTAITNQPTAAQSTNTNFEKEFTDLNTVPDNIQKKDKYVCCCVERNGCCDIASCLGYYFSGIGDFFRAFCNCLCECCTHSDDPEWNRRNSYQKKLRRNKDKPKSNKINTKRNTSYGVGNACWVINEPYYCNSGVDYQSGGCNDSGGKYCGGDSGGGDCGGDSGGGDCRGYSGGGDSGGGDCGGGDSGGCAD